MPQQITRNKATKEFISLHSPSRTDGRIPDDLDPAVELVDIINPPVKPTFDPLTQKIIAISSEQPGAAGFPIRLVQDWAVVPLTQLELDDLAADVASVAEREQAKAMVTNLRNPGTDTQQQRLSRVEKCCARIVTDLYK